MAAETKTFEDIAKKLVRIFGCPVIAATNDHGWYEVKLGDDLLPYYDLTDGEDETLCRTIPKIQVDFNEAFAAEQGEMSGLPLAITAENAQNQPSSLLLTHKYLVKPGALTKLESAYRTFKQGLSHHRRSGR